MESGYFGDKFIASLPKNTDQVILAIHREYGRFLENDYDLNEEDDFNFDFVEVVALIRVLEETQNFEILPSNAGVNEITANDLSVALNNAAEAANLRLRQQKYEAGLNKYRNHFSAVVFYEFNDDDFKRIQTLISELRESISKSEIITSDHKGRLLHRLEAMQGELHKKTSDIDRFWGFIGEAGIVIGKFGNDVKPISDRVKELGAIVCAVIAAKEGLKALPYVVKLLE